LKLFQTYISELGTEFVYKSLHCTWEIIMADRLDIIELNSQILQPLDKQIATLRNILLEFDTIVLTNDLTISISEKQNAINIRDSIKQKLAETILEHARFSQFECQK